jgi:hypothetical protein
LHFIISLFLHAAWPLEGARLSAIAMRSNQAHDAASLIMIAVHLLPGKNVPVVITGAAETASVRKTTAVRETAHFSRRQMRWEAVWHWFGARPW